MYIFISFLLGLVLGFVVGTLLAGTFSFFDSWKRWKQRSSDEKTIEKKEKKKRRKKDV